MAYYPATKEELAELQELCHKALSTSPHVSGKVWSKAGAYHYVICYTGSSPGCRAGVIYANVSDLRAHYANTANAVQLVYEAQFDGDTIETVIALGLDLIGPLKALGKQDGGVPS